MANAEIVDLRAVAASELVRRAESKANDAELQLRQQYLDSKSGPEIGGTGLKVFNGVIDEEHNRDWQTPTLYDTVDKMRKGDATIASIGLAISLPILATQVHIEAKAAKDEKPDPIVEEAAEFVHDNLFSGTMMKRSWNDILRESMLYLYYGHYPFEIVYQEVGSGRWDGAIAWKKFGPRHPRTITEWQVDRFGELSYVRQQIMAAEFPLDVTIPADKLLLFTNQPEAGNPLGVSMLRPAYKHWRYKDGFYAVQAIAIERQGAGTPYGKYPAGTPGPEKDKLEQMLQNIQAHEQSYFAYEEDWEVGFVDMGASSVLDPAKAIEHHDGQIAKAVLASFMQLPQDGKGSFALSSDQSGFFNFSLNQVAQTIAAVWNQHAIPKMLDFNYPNLPQYPRLRFDRVGHISIDKILDHVAKLAEKGILTSDIDLENRVRDILNLPPVDEETFEEEREPEEPVAPVQPAAPGGNVE